MPEPQNTNQIRLDAAVVNRGLSSSRSRAQALIKAGAVAVNGQTVKKPSALLGEDDQIVLSGDPMPYVSRAALKLKAGLAHFKPDPSGKTALDLGASTGGFCEVLLEAGVGLVLAIDVGHGQLAGKIADHAQVTSFEGVNARDLATLDLPPYQIITADLSFISLRLALPPALDIAPKGCWLIALIKPQFEVGRENIGKGGIVKDPALHRTCCDDITAFLIASGWTVQDVIDSPIAGGDGNKEFLIGAIKS